MTTFFITRHRGAIEWARQEGIDAVIKDHLDIDEVKPADVVLGTLPVHIVAALNAKGVRFKQLAYATPPALRGAELSADDLRRLGAKLLEFRVERVE
jgi:CRISPR-associated protein Csx16